MMMRNALLAALLLLVPSAWADWPRECRPDVGRLCREQSQAADREVLACLKDQERRLSQACRRLLQTYGHLPK
jgi:hypothetical protein